MRSKVMLWSLLLAVGLVTILASGVWAQGGGGGGRGGGQGAMMYLDRAWTALSFGLTLTDAQVAALRPTFQTSFATRAETMKTVMAAQDRQAAMQDAMATMAKIKPDMDAKMKEVPTADQLAAIQPMLTMGGGRRGGGGGGGGQ